MILRRIYFGSCFLLLLGGAQGCTEEPVVNEVQEPIEKLEEVKNESVITTLNKITNDTTPADIIKNPETKKKVEKLKAERVDKLTKKVNASPFKGFTDEEIKVKLEDELKRYSATCDSSLINQIFDQMAYDAVLSIFKQRQSDFCRSYFKEIQKVKKECNK